MEDDVQETVALVTEYIRREKDLETQEEVLYYWFSLTDEQKAELFNRAMDS